MAEAAYNGEEIVYTFDISDENLLKDAEIMLKEIAESEKEEVPAVVNTVESLQNNSLDDFQLLQKPLRHKQVNGTELDWLASKNSTETTAYQTKWAASAMKGTNNYILQRFYTKHDFLLGSTPYAAQIPQL